jgi:hypothetical protein
VVAACVIASAVRPLQFCCRSVAASILAALRTGAGGGDVPLESRENLDHARRGSWKVDRQAQGIEDPTQGSHVDTRRQVGC